jgi:hypothetical protein
VTTKTQARSDKQKRRRGQKETRTSERPAAVPHFEHERFNLWEAARQWLRRQRVPRNQWEAWISLLPDHEPVVITLDDWRSRVDALLRPWYAAGFVDAEPDDEYTLRGRINDLDLGVGLSEEGVSVQEVTEGDAIFRQSISDTGYHHFTELRAQRTSPAGLVTFLAKHMREFRAELAKKQAREKRRLAQQGRDQAVSLHKASRAPRRKGRLVASAARKPSPDPRPPSPASRPPAPASTALVPVPATAGPLSKAEKHDLAKLEAVIRKGVESFTAVGIPGGSRMAPAGASQVASSPPRFWTCWKGSLTYGVVPIGARRKRTHAKAPRR